MIVVSGCNAVWDGDDDEKGGEERRGEESEKVSLKGTGI